MFLSVFSENIGTIAVVAVLALISLLVIFRLIKNKKEGKSSCGCGCGSCPMSGMCHSEGASKTLSEKATDSKNESEPC